ncbi:MAG: hypothetical protein EP343_27990 [Deltaproteobacteria bacterium]|nr:MAG: hypothetical protein EP343_27990 [Deltaproteobacteria bacterium]
MQRYLCALALLLCFAFFESNVWADTPDSKSGVKPSVLPLPKGPGSLEGVGENVKLSLNMGVMSYGIPIKMPKGRNGFTPQLGLSYSSGGGSSIVGMGWSLSGLKSIERYTARRLPKYDSADTFTASDGGELVKIVGTPYHRSRFEGGFVRFQWHRTSNTDQQGYWTAEYPNGSIGYFGASHIDLNTTQATQDRDSQDIGAYGTYRWYLRSLVDRNGSRIDYIYKRIGSQAPKVYLTEVSWVYNTNGNSLYTASLQYESRPDAISDGKAGFEIQTRERIKAIKIASNNKPLRSYQLSYDDKEGLSRLSHVTQYGIDGRTPYPIKFTMEYTSAKASGTSSKMVSMPTGTGLNLKSGQVDLLDINGDGLPDLVDTSRGKHVFHINTMTVDSNLQTKSHDFPLSQRIANPQSLSASLKSKAVQMLDVNGDGFTDLLDLTTKAVVLNKGQGRWEDTAQNLTVSTANLPHPSNNVDARFFNYDGDKKTDVIVCNGVNTTYWVGDGKGAWKAVQGSTHIKYSFSKDKMQLFDINGDGLQDLIRLSEGKIRVKLYLGWGRWTSWTEVSVNGLTQGMLPSVQFGDLNGDSLRDVIVLQGTTLHYFLNRNGSSFGSKQSITSVGGQTLPDSSTHTVRFADINGNGSRDIVWFNSSGQITYLDLFGQKPNLLSRVSNGIGKQIEVVYSSSVAQMIRDRQNQRPWKHRLPMPFSVVRQVKIWADGPNNVKLGYSEQEVHYHDGFYDGIEKQFRGFREVLSVHKGDASVEDKQERYTFRVGSQDVHYKGKLVSKMISNAQNKTYQTQTVEYKDCKVGGIPSPSSLSYAVRFVCQSIAETLHQEGRPQTEWKTTRKEYTFDSYGNTTLVAELGEKGKPGDEKYTATEYILPGNGRWMLRLLKRRQIYANPTSHRKTDERFYYDEPAFVGMPYGQAKKGNLARVTAQIDVGKPDLVERQRGEYDSYGNLLSRKDANGNIRNFTWDPQYSLFPVSEEVVLPGYSLKMSAVWDLARGVVVESSSWNGHKTAYGYDTFVRQISVAKPGDTLQAPTQRYVYDLKSPFSRIITQQRSQKGQPYDLEKQDCFDGAGRKIQTRSKIKDGLYQITGHVEFNALSKPYKQWNPYQDPRDACFLQPPKTLPFVTSSFDALGRMTRKTNQDGTFSRVEYRPFQTTTFDEEDTRQGSKHYNTPSSSLVNGLGHVLQVTTMDKPNRTITKTFAWNVTNTLSKDGEVGLPQLVQYTDPLGYTKSHTVDLLGRVTSVKSPNTGTTQYTFDKQGNLVKRTDARGIATLYSYDKANRTTSLMEEGKPSTRIRFFYDKVNTSFPQASNVRSKLIGISYPTGSEWFSYDTRERLVHYQKRSLGTHFDFSMTYDNVDRLTKKTYPDGRSLSMTFDGLSRILSIPGMMVQCTYTTTGQLASWTASNGIVTSYNFDSRLRLSSAQVNQGKLLDFTYTYDGVGNFLTIKDLTETNIYQYDSLYRLTQAKLNNKETLSYSYNDVGNILSKASSLGSQSPAHVGSYSYSQAQPYAVNQAGSVNLSYDKAGNAQSHRGFKHTWDFMGRRKETHQGNKLLGRYWYGAGKVRQMKREQGLHTLYFSDDHEIRNGQSIIYVLLGKQRIGAKVTTAGVKKLYDDLAPSKDTASVTPEPDGKITVADAMLYHQVQSGKRQGELRKRELATDLADDMMQHSLQTLLHESQERKLFLHNDHLGSVRAVTDGKGEVVGTTKYYPYGAAYEEKGSPVFYGYMNTEKDVATQLNYAKTRYLDTNLGRWVSADGKFEKLGSVGDEFNVYWYVGNNPIRFVDRNGEAQSDSGDGAVSYGYAKPEEQYTLWRRDRSNRQMRKMRQQYNEAVHKQKEHMLVPLAVASAPALAAGGVIAFHGAGIAYTAAVNGYYSVGAYYANSAIAASLATPLSGKVQQLFGAGSTRGTVVSQAANFTLSEMGLSDGLPSINVFGNTKEAWDFGVGVGKTINNILEEQKPKKQQERTNHK